MVVAKYAVIHDAKLDALEDLIEELAGQALLVAYMFQSDLERLQERFPGTPTLTGLSHKQIVEVEAAWNAGEIKMLFAHPASAGHGLNLQGSGASHVCWFSRPWDLDLYDQFIRRLLRQGTTAQRVVSHSLVVKNSIDELIGTALGEKDVTQRRLLTALNAEIIHDTTTGGNVGLKKLGFQGEQGGAATAAPEPAKIPKGWGAAATENGQQDMANEPPAAEPAKTPRGWGSAAAAPEAPKDEQRQAINQKLRAPEPEQEEDEQPPVASRALEAFGAGVVQQLGGGAPPAEVPVSAAGAPVATPRGWGSGTAEVLNLSPADAVPAENAEKPARKARRSAPAAPDAQAQGSALTAGTAPATHSAGTTITETRGLGDGEYIKIELNGLPARAVAAALRAIADACVV